MSFQDSAYLPETLARAAPAELWPKAQPWRAINTLWAPKSHHDAHSGVQWGYLTTKDDYLQNKSFFHFFLVLLGI